MNGGTALLLALGLAVVIVFGSGSGRASTGRAVAIRGHGHNRATIARHEPEPNTLPLHEPLAGGSGRPP